LVGLGFSVIFENYPITHEIIKVLGVVYLIYLAWLIASSAPVSLESIHSKPFSFIQAASFQWVNPKAWVMATGAVAAYTTVSTNVFIQVIYIALAFFMVAFPCVGIWLYFGSALKRYLKSTRHQKMFNVSMAFLLVASVFPVLQALINQYVA